MNIFQVRTGRGIRGYAMPPHCTRAERRDVEAILCSALCQLTGPFKGMDKSWLCDFCMVPKLYLIGLFCYDDIVQV